MGSRWVQLHARTKERTGRAGRRLVFSWDESELAYDRAFAGTTDLDEAILGGLEEDTDLRTILPWEEKAVGEFWFVDADVLRQVLWPGGSMAFVDEEGRYLVKPVGQRLTTYLDGTLRVEFVDLVASDGGSLAHLRFRGRLEAETRFGHDMSVRFFDSALELAVEQKLQLYMEVEGGLDWNIGAGHLASLSLEGRVSVDQVAVFAVEDEPFYSSEPFELTGTWEGTLTVEVVVEPGEF